MSRALSSFIAAWVGLRLLQSKTASTKSKSNSDKETDEVSVPSTKLAGRTIDLTLFAATRAVDVLVGELWSQRRARRKAVQKWTWVCTKHGVVSK